MDRGFLYGDGVFETIRAYEYIPFRLGNHIARLRESAKALRITIPRSDQQIASDVSEALRRNTLADAVIRISISRGLGERGLAINPLTAPTYIILVFPLPADVERIALSGLNLEIARIARTPSMCLPIHAKHANALNCILAKAEAQEAGADDALMLSTTGQIAETTNANFFLLKDASLSTPSRGVGLLAGITRNVVLELASEIGLQTLEDYMTPEHVETADEAFVTNSVIGIVPVKQIGSRRFPSPGPRTLQLMKLYRNLTRRA